MCDWSPKLIMISWVKEKLVLKKNVSQNMVLMKVIWSLYFFNPLRRGHGFFLSGNSEEVLFSFWRILKVNGPFPSFSFPFLLPSTFGIRRNEKGLKIYWELTDELFFAAYKRFIRLMSNGKNRLWDECVASASFTAVVHQTKYEIGHFSKLVNRRPPWNRR